MALNIGSLDRYVTVQSVSYADDDYGDGQTPTWANYATSVPMKFDSLGGNSPSEKFEASQKVDIDMVTWTARYDSGILDTMRIVYDSENYHIIKITPKGRKEYMEILTEKKDNE